MDLTRSDTAGIKGIAIILMLWHHLFLNTTEYGMLTQSLAIAFKVCVALFLFVSGYGLMKQYRGLDQRNVRTTIVFLLRRFINFFLPFWFCFALVTLIGNLCGYTFQDAYPATRNTLKCVILDFFGQMGYDSYLNPWWFNKMIIQLYLIFPLVYLMTVNKYLASLGLIAILLIQLFASSFLGGAFFLVEGGLPAFYLGMVSARYQVIPSIRHRKWKIVWVSVWVLLIIGLAVLHHHVLSKDTNSAVLIRAFMAFCIVCTYKSLDGQHVPIWVFLGKYATIMYLTHMLLIVLIPKVLYFSKYSVPVFISFFVACLIMAMAINWIERVMHYDKLRMDLVKFVYNR